MHVTADLVLLDAHASADLVRGDGGAPGLHGRVGCSGTREPRRSLAGTVAPRSCLSTRPCTTRQYARPHGTALRAPQPARRRPRTSPSDLCRPRRLGRHSRDAGALVKPTPRLAGPLASPRPRTSGAGHLGAFNAAEAPHGWTSSWRPRRPPLPRCARPLFGVSRGRAMPHRPVCSARHGGGAGGRRAPGSSCVSPCV